MFIRHRRRVSWKILNKYTNGSTFKSCPDQNISDSENAQLGALLLHSGVRGYKIMAPQSPWSTVSKMRVRNHGSVCCRVPQLTHTECFQDVRRYISIIPTIILLILESGQKQTRTNKQKTRQAFPALFPHKIHNCIHPLL